MTHLFLRIFGTLAGVVILIAALTILIFHTLGRPVERSVAIEELDFWWEQAVQRLPAGDRAVQIWFDQIAQRRQIRLTLLISDEHQIGAEVSPRVSRALREALNETSNQALTTLRLGSRVYALRLHHIGRRTIGLLATWNRLENVTARPWASAAVILLAVVLACLWLAWRLTLPVRELQRVAAQMSSGDLSGRPALQLQRRADVFGDLAREFSTMAERVEHLISSQQQLLRDISHELRTPLARLQVALALASREEGHNSAMLARIEAELMKLDELIGEVLELARMDSGTMRFDLVRFDLAELLDHITEDCRFEFRDKSVKLESVFPDTLEISGDQMWLARAVENILRNALRHSADNTTVVLALAEQPDYCEISVCDCGPGVAEADLERLFAPFVRLDGARCRDNGGYGIGLALTRSVMRAHSGEVFAQNLKPNGLCMTLRLPYTVPEPVAEDSD